MKRKTIDIITLGCSKNLVDSEHLMRQLEEVGFHAVSYTHLILPLKYYELPGTEVIRAAIPPPVQLSAVERDNFFAFSSSPTFSSNFIPYYILS